MAWYAYCIADKNAFPEVLHHRKPVPFESVAGILGNQVFLYPASDLAIIVSEHLPPDTLDQKAAVDHARVVGDCFRRGTVLPFRFGTIFHDDEALRRSVRSNQRQFLANVERLRGKAEMHLKVVVDDCCPGHEKTIADDSVGKEYLSSLRENATRQRERQTKARALSVQMHRIFSPLEEEISCRRTDQGKMLLDIAHLVDQKCVEKYQARLHCCVIAACSCQARGRRTTSYIGRQGRLRRQPTLHRPEEVECGEKPRQLPGLFYFDDSINYCPADSPADAGRFLRPRTSRPLLNTVGLFRRRVDAWSILRQKAVK
jgi:Gas vesicle synthesis protein GvpL/GvpF